VVGVPGHRLAPGTPVQEPEDNLRFVRREKELCDADTQGQGAADETDRHGAMRGRFDVGYDRTGVWVDRVATGVPGAAGKRLARGFLGEELREHGGKQVANELVRRCLQVSSGTHPPCKAQNSCKLMETKFSEDADC